MAAWPIGETGAALLEGVPVGKYTMTVMAPNFRLVRTPLRIETRAETVDVVLVHTASICKFIAT